MVDLATTPGSTYTADEMMTVTASRHLASGAVCFVGIGLPSAAANLARLTHAPDLVLIYESGTIATRPVTLPLSIGDTELATTALSVVSVPEIFAYWLQGGRVDVGFLSAAQIDRYGNLNSTVIGSYEHPKVRLPGAGGAPEIAAAAGEVFVMLRHQKRMFVEAVDFVTSVGFGRDGKGRPGCWGAGPTAVITDLGVLRPDPATHELILTAVHPGVEVDRVIDETGWDLGVSPAIEVTDPPTAEELAVLRDLMQRTEAAHRR
ncbi:MAG TPA: CoA-transferase [Acidimicrobiia bacterium]|nr:CoA-transferase [Acidimicrobiia bacterium]